ncbi:uncharacterized protein LOC134231735 [Saccostrea cucullata]|uniref:uncharacterized protein LOC134231735 n=1 Tax=Saccostrea cuccullata TaxID=36930 RepID=UPI002ED34D0B
MDLPLCPPTGDAGTNYTAREPTTTTPTSTSSMSLGTTSKTKTSTAVITTTSTSIKANARPTGLNKDLSMSTDSDSSSTNSAHKSAYDKDTIVSKKADQLSIMTDGVIDPPQEYTVPETTGAQYKPTSKQELKVKDMMARQKEIITLDVGGTKFTTTKSTLQEDPSSLLAALSSKTSETLFIDRNPKHFPVILDFLRNGCCTSDLVLPASFHAIKELYQECVFYELDNLTKHLEPLLKYIPSQ